jgi:hypothetical protein
MTIALLQDIIAELLTSRQLREAFRQDRHRYLVERGIDDPSTTPEIDVDGLETAARSTVRKRFERTDLRFPRFFAALEVNARSIPRSVLLDVRFGTAKTENLIASVAAQAASLGDPCGGCLVSLIRYDSARSALSVPPPVLEQAAASSMLVGGTPVRLADWCAVLASSVDLPTLLREIDGGDWKCRPMAIDYLILRKADGMTALAELAPPLASWASELKDWGNVREFVERHGERGSQFIDALWRTRALETREVAE